MEPLSWALIELGRSINGAQYLTSVQELQKISRQIAQYFEGIDVLLTPTLGEPPAPLGTFDSPPGEPLAGLFRAADYVPFTPPFNVTGQPAISLPLHWNDADLPSACRSACSSSGASATRRRCSRWPASSSRRRRGRRAGRRSRRRQEPGGRLLGRSVTRTQRVPE